MSDPQRQTPSDTPRTDAAYAEAKEQRITTVAALCNECDAKITALEQRLAAAERDAERWQALVDLWALGTLTLELNESGFYEAHIEVPGEGASVCIGSAEEIIDSSRGEWDAALKERHE